MPRKEHNHFDHLTKLEEKNIQKTRKHFSKELDFWKQNLNMVYEALTSINNSYSEKWSYSKKASVFLLPRLIMSAKTSLELLTRGYYFDYTIVERSLYESVALLAFLSKDEEAAKKWFNFEKLEIPKWKLMHQLFPSPSKKMLARIDKTYAYQCEFVHSTFFAIFSDFLAHLSRNRKVLDFPKFKKSQIGDVISSPICALILLILIEVYKKELKKSFRTKATNFIGEKISEWKANGLLKEANGARACMNRVLKLFDVFISCSQTKERKRACHLRICRPPVSQRPSRLPSAHVESTV